MEQIVFFTYEDGDFGFYQRLLSEYFPTLDNRSVTTHSMKYKNDDPSIDSTTTNCHVLVSTGKSDETNHANLNETCVITTLIIENRTKWRERFRHHRAHNGSFKNQKNAFLNDPNSQK